MDDLSRLPFDCNCSCDSCTHDPDPGTDYTLPGDVRFGTARWRDLMGGRPADGSFDLATGGPDDDEFLSEYDLLDDARPTWEDIEAWEEATRGEPSAHELALAIAEIRRGEDQSNGYFAILDEGRPEDVDRWYNRDIVDF